MKKSINLLLVCILALLSPSTSNGQNIFEGFENNSCQFGGGNNSFFLGCHNNWISISGTPDNILLVQPSEGNSAAHMYSTIPANNCPGYTGESIALNYNFQAGVTYEISYELQWFNPNPCHEYKAEWVLTNNRNNTSGSPSNCGDIIPFVMPSDDIIVNHNLNTPSNGWNTFSQTFTPTSNYNQIWLRPQLKAKCSSSSNQNHLHLDAFEIDPCAGYTSDFSTFGDYDQQGNLSITAVADPTPEPVYHWWSISDSNGNSVPGNPAVYFSSTALFPNLQTFTEYTIQHIIFNHCSGFWEGTQSTGSVNPPSLRGEGEVAFKVKSKDVNFKPTAAQISAMNEIISKASSERMELHNQNKLQFTTKPPVNSITNYPNPFTNTTTIEFTLEEEQTISLSVYDLRGRLIAKLLENEPKSAGQNQITFDGSSLTEGIYFYTIESNGFKETKKMVLSK